MYYQHPDLPPIDISQKIWHYYSLPKFLSLLSTSSLYLCRQDEFDDSFEGVMTKKDVDFFESKSAGITKGMEGDAWDAHILTAGQSRMLMSMCYGTLMPH